MLFAIVFAAALTRPDCWTLYHAALQHSATRTQAPVVVYDEAVTIELGGTPVVDREQQLSYRAGQTPPPEPGPPELFPNRSARDDWLQSDGDVKTIASVRVRGNLSCEITGSEQYGGHTVYHLSFVPDDAAKPGLRAMYVDAETSDIWKLVVAGYVHFQDTVKLADYTIELGYVGPYFLVQRVSWSCGAYTAQYNLRHFSFPGLSEARP